MTERIGGGPFPGGLTVNAFRCGEQRVRRCDAVDEQVSWPQGEADGVTSPYSLLAASKGVYGEAVGEWTAADALGHARILSLPGSLQRRAGGGSQ